MIESRCGLCMDMCSKEEIHRREGQNRVHPFECKIADVRTPISNKTEKHGRLNAASKSYKNYSHKGKADHSKMVKEFQRSAAGKVMLNMDDIRPPEILEKTTFYLIDNILHNENLEWYAAYDFVLDRLKAIRQDLVIQSIWDETCCNILQCAVRFHTYSCYRLCEEDTKCFDPHLNYANLHECLARLVTLRSSMNNESFERMEVEALYLVHNLGSNEILNRAFGLPKKITCHEMVKLALEINLAFVKSNYVRVMRIARKLPFILLCALLRHIEEIKKRALMIMSSAYSCRNVKYPVSCLSPIIASDELECIELCKYYDIQVSGDSQSVLFNKASCAKAKLPPPPCKYKFMQRKHDGIDLRSFFRGQYEMV